MVGLQSELVLKELAQSFVAPDDRAAVPECCFGFHRETGKLLVVGLVAEPVLSTRECRGRVAVGKTGATCSFEQVKVNRLEASPLVLGPEEVAAAERFAGEQCKRPLEQRRLIIPVDATDLGQELLELVKVDGDAVAVERIV